MGRNWQNNRPFSRQNYDRKKRYNHVSACNENYETSRYGNFNSNNYRDHREDYTNESIIPQMKETINKIARRLTSEVQKCESEFLRVEKTFLELKQVPLCRDMEYIRSFCYRYDRFRLDLNKLGSILEDLNPLTEMFHSMMNDLTLLIGESENPDYVDVMLVSRIDMVLGKYYELQRDSCGYDEAYIAQATAATTWEDEYQTLIQEVTSLIGLDKMPTEGKDETIENDTYLDENSEEINLSSELESAEIEILQRDENDFEVQGSGEDLIKNNENKARPTEHDEEKLPEKQELSQTTSQAIEITSSLLIVEPQSKNSDTEARELISEEYIMPEQIEGNDKEIVDENYLEENTEEIKVSMELEDTVADWRKCNESEEIEPMNCGADLTTIDIMVVKLEENELDTGSNDESRQDIPPSCEVIKLQLGTNETSKAKLSDESILIQNETNAETVPKLPGILIEESECKPKGGKLKSPRTCKRVTNYKKLSFSNKDTIGRKRGNRNQTKNIRKNSRKRLQRSITHDMSQEKLACREYVTKSDEFMYNLYMFSLRGRVKLSKDIN